MKTFIQCDCFTEILLVEKDEELGYIYFSMFEKRGNFKLSLWNRIRHCIHILKTGMPFSDQVVLSPDKSKALADFLLKGAEND